MAAALETTAPAGLPEVVQRLVDHYQPLKVIPFGSYAWGEPHRDSDVDLFVVKESDESFLDRRRSALEALYDTGHVPFPVDVLVYTPGEIEWRLSLGDPFVGDILRRGRLLYDAARPGVV